MRDKKKTCYLGLDLQTRNMMKVGGAYSSTENNI